MTDSSTKAPSLALRLILGVLAIVMVAVPLALVTLAPPVKPIPKGIKVAPQRIVPRTELPPVEPVEFQKDVDPNSAVAFNDTIPFVTGGVQPARPFLFTGSAADRARAIDCLAIAQLYEAGDDTEGERSVAQVILNRVRHPAFPKSICGVVFQGSERRTGCQFSFTCDGAMTRWRPNPGAMARARDVAIAAIGGTVYPQVGLATHYHTNWVVPYWSSSLDKIAQVRTHLFFRWTGWWGTPAAFARTVSGYEPNIGMLGGVGLAHVGPGPGAALADAEVTPAEVIAAPVAGETNAGGGAPLSIDPNSFLVTLDPRAGADSFPAVAMRACGARDYCKLMAWTDRTRTPGGLPLGQAQIATMSFSYLRDKQHGYEKALWNCAQFKRASKGECMKLQVLGVTQPVVPPAGAKPLVPGGGVATGAARPGAMPTPGVSFQLKPAGSAVPPEPLGGVRRKPGGGPAPVPVPTPAAPVERP